MNTTYLELSESTYFGMEAFLVFGRALAIAEHYERRCADLNWVLQYPKAKLIQLRRAQNALEVDAILEAHFKKIRGKQLNEHVREICAIMELLPEEVRGHLHTARVARNRIAHGMTRDWEFNVEQESEKQRLARFRRIRSDVTAIAKADWLVCSLITALTDEPFQTGKEAQGRYVEMILEWVFDVNLE